MDKLEEQRLTSLLADPQTQRKAFEMVVRQYSEQLYWQIRRIVLTHEDADDVLQNTFIKAWGCLDNFRYESKLYTWLYRIAINESLDFIRKQKAAVAVDNDSLTVANQLMADEYFDGDKAEAKLQEAIAMLPDVQRLVFCMRYYDEVKYCEMSKILKTTEGSLKASYHVAVKKISEYLGLKD